MIQEVFKPVLNYPKYHISNKGRVLSLWKRKGKPIILKPSYPAGYPAVKLVQNKKVVCRHIHRLVLEAFVGPADGKITNHKDGDKRNNNLENLEWCTYKENLHHAMEMGLWHPPKGFGYPVEQLDEEGNVVAQYSSMNIACQQTKIWGISSVCRGERKTAGGFKWRYVHDS